MYLLFLNNKELRCQQRNFKRGIALLESHKSQNIWNRVKSVFSIENRLIPWRAAEMCSINTLKGAPTHPLTCLFLLNTRRANPFVRRREEFLIALPRIHKPG